MTDLTDQEVKDQTVRVQHIIDKYLTTGIGWWSVTYRWIRASGDMPRVANSHIHGEGGETVFTVASRWEYRTADLHVNLQSVHDVKDDLELERYYAHEIAHILVKPMQNLERDDADVAHEELVCSTIGDALAWAFAWQAPAKRQAKRPRKDNSTR